MQGVGCRVQGAGCMGVGSQGFGYFERTSSPGSRRSLTIVVIVLSSSTDSPPGSGYSVSCPGFRVEVLGVIVQGSEFRIYGSGFRV